MRQSLSSINKFKNSKIQKFKDNMVLTVLKYISKFQYQIFSYLNFIIKFKKNVFECLINHPVY